MENMDMDWLRKHVCYESSDVLLSQAFPLGTSVGEGFEFELDSVRYRTSGRYDGQGRRIAEFRVSSFAGFCAGASHWYCRARLAVENRKEGGDGVVAGYLRGVKIPSSFSDIVFDVCRPLTREDFVSDPDRYEYCDEGDPCVAFCDRDELLGVIEQMKPFFGPGWAFEITY